MMKYLLSTLMLLFIFGELRAQQSNPINVATYNLRYDNPNDGMNAWPYRKQQVEDLIRYHSFDIFGTEEGLIGMLNDLSEMKEYARTGGGRDDGKQAGEHSAIFYRIDRFQLLKYGDFWLSETPDKPSYGWDATGNRRICSWGKFKDKTDGKEFYFFCVHFDNQGVIARHESSKLMVKKIKEIVNDGSPIFCVGDFNSTPETEQIQVISSFLQDSRKITQMLPYGPVGTFEGFDYANAPLKDRIDYIFVSNKITVLKYAVLTDSYDHRYPSDHLPVVAKVIIQ